MVYAIPHSGGKNYGHVPHARAKTTPAVRREIQSSQESLIKLAARYGVNPKTVEKWRKRDFAHDAPMGPKVIRSRSLSQIEEAAIVTFRVFTQLPLDDCLYSLQGSIPHLTRSSLHRCLQRHGLQAVSIYSHRQDIKVRIRGIVR